MHPRIYPLSETAITIEWGEHMEDSLHQLVLNLDHSLRQQPFEGLVECVPAYVSLTVFYQANRIAQLQDDTPFLFVKRTLEALLLQMPATIPASTNLVSIPVCYDDAWAPDLDLVASLNGLSKEAVIAMHQQQVYKVYMMGFLPGFAYMGILDENMAAPRKPTPRAKVEAGSVGIAGRQTGIYPLNAPGGWQIIGRTPCTLFDPEKANPFLLKTGDTVQFYAISEASFSQAKLLPKEQSLTDATSVPADVEVLKPGPYSSIQDQGRFGFRAYGVPVGGAMDGWSHHVANALVGNTPHAATLECTMGGLVIQFKKATLIALTGGGTGAINGNSLAFYRPYMVSPNDILEIRFNHQGIRTYLAVQGGFAAEKRMGSRSVSPMAGIGAPLKKGDLLRFDQEQSCDLQEITELGTVPYSPNIRVFRGPEFDWLSPESQERFYAQYFTLSHRFDRMGGHLQAAPLAMSASRELLSTAVSAGTIQCTPNGQLILLLQDCQTTGGYPRVGQIAAVDLPAVAQWIPGEPRVFTEIVFSEAEALYLHQQKAIHALFR
jgi:KipI family sensor histidine kinase inhibitor